MKGQSLRDYEGTIIKGIVKGRLLKDYEGIIFVQGRLLRGLYRQGQ